MKKTITYLGKAIALASIFLVCSISHATTFYFSSSLGDDNRSTAQAQNQNTPWRSIQKLNAIFSSLQPGDNILFKNGDTFQGTIIISKSGTSGAPITIGSFGSGEKPILTGMKKINDWVSKGGNIYEVQIPEIGTALSTVVIDNVMHAMGRYPNDNAANSGYLTINSFSGGTIGSSQLQAPANMTGGEIVIRKNNWIIDRHIINWHGGTSINYNTSGSSYSPKIGYGFFIQNHLSTLDKHGEWFFDKATKKLSIFFQGNPWASNIRVSTMPQVITIQNSASHIKLNNLTIQGSNDNLISIDKSSNFTVENCQLEFVGKNAIYSIMSRNLLVTNSKIENSQNSGIYLRWDDRAPVIRNNTFSKNFLMAGMGQNADMQGNGIYMSETTADAIVENSSFFEHGFNAIYFHGNNAMIRNNFIDTYCFVKDDGAGIYTYTGPSNTNYTNRKVLNNIIINGIGAVGGTKPFGATDLPYVEGIYLDTFVSGVELDGNTISNVKGKGIFINNSRSITATNNKIYNTGYSIFITSDFTDNLTRNLILNNNQFLKKNANQIHIYVRSKVNYQGNLGSFENNVYSRPSNENNTIRLETPGKNGMIDLQEWKNSFGLDRSSTKSPTTFDPNKLSIDDFIFFEYNYSNSSKSLPLSGTYMDLKGKVLTGSVTIPAYSSVMLLKTESGPSLPNVGPIVSITDPLTNAQFNQGANINIAATASDSDGTVAKVEFFNGTSLLGTDTTSPFSFTWANLPTGSFTLSAKATDNKGTSTVSTLVNINVGNIGNVAPTVSLTSPTANAQFSQGANISITANAADSDGTISKVEFFNGSTLLGTDTTSPYNFAWSNPPSGNLTLTAKAIDNQGSSTVSPAINISVSGTTTSRSAYKGTPATIPGTVEAENYDIGGQGITYFDVDQGNNGGIYRTDDVDLGGASEGGFTLGWMNVKEWLEYTVNITTAGAYNLDARVASPGAGGTFHIELNGVDVTGPLTIPATGSWNTWASVKKSGVNLPAGTHVLRYVLDSYGATGYFGNFNSMTFTNPNNTQTTTDINDGGNSSRSPFGGKAATIPGRVEAENFDLGGQDVAYFDVDKGNKGGLYRTEDVDIGGASEGGFTLGWMNVKEWLEYTVNISAAGSYNLDARVASPGAGGTFHIECNGVDVTGPLVIPATGGWNTWTSVKKSGVNLPAGTHVLRYVLDSYGATGYFGNFNSVTFTNPDLTASSETYMVTVLTTTEETSDKITAPTSLTKALPGEKLIFIAEEAEEEGVFDYWSVNGVEVGDQSLLELEMPEKDVTLTKHFRTFVNPEVKIVLPGQKSDVEALSEVQIQIETKNNDAIIDKVELFNGEDLVGEFSEDSSAIALKNIPEGSHQLVARITDTNGNSYFSDPVMLNSIRNTKDIRNVLLEYVIGPNPTTDHLNVIFKNLDGQYDFEFRIVSMNGIVQKSFSVRPEESTITIDVSDLQTGTYILHVLANGKNHSSKKFVKNK